MLQWMMLDCPVKESCCHWQQGPGDEASTVATQEMESHKILHKSSIEQQMRSGIQEQYTNVKQVKKTSVTWKKKLLYTLFSRYLLFRTATQAHRNQQSPQISCFTCTSCRHGGVPQHRWDSILRNTRKKPGILLWAGGGERLNSHLNSSERLRETKPTSILMRNVTEELSEKLLIFTWWVPGIMAKVTFSVHYS